MEERERRAEESKERRERKKPTSRTKDEPSHPRSSSDVQVRSPINLLINLFGLVSTFLSTKLIYRVASRSTSMMAGEGG